MFHSKTEWCYATHTHSSTYILITQSFSHVLQNQHTDDRFSAKRRQEKENIVVYLYVKQKPSGVLAEKKNNNKLAIFFTLSSSSSDHQWRVQSSSTPYSSGIKLTRFRVFKKTDKYVELSCWSRGKFLTLEALQNLRQQKLKAVFWNIHSTPLIWQIGKTIWNHFLLMVLDGLVWWKKWHDIRKP